MLATMHMVDIYPLLSDYGAQRSSIPASGQYADTWTPTFCQAFNQ